MRTRFPTGGSSRAALLLTGTLALWPAGLARAAVIGPGTAIPNEARDSAGGRINVDQGSPLTLQPGTYTATLFNFDAGLAGDVTPFLATGGGASNQYTAIAVGSTQSIAAAAQDQAIPFGGSNTFTLNVATEVFAGIASQTQNPIALDNGTANNTEHEGGGQAASSYVVTLGGAVPPDGAFSNPNLGRTYAFSVTVEVPEPTGLGLGMLGLGLLARRRRHACRRA